MRRHLTWISFVLVFMVLAACGPGADSGQVMEPSEASSAANEQQDEIEQTPIASDSDEVDQPAEAQQEEEMQLTSSAFSQGEPIPAEYSCDGDDVSPPLAWSGVPAETQSFALIMDDPDAPGGTWDHWLLFNIPADSRSLDRAVLSQDNLADGSRHGQNSWGNREYGGPCPPGGTHRYFFKIYALDQALELAAGASKAELEAALQGHILAETELMGTFSR